VKFVIKNGGGGSFHGCSGIWGEYSDCGDWVGPPAVSKVAMVRGRQKGFLHRIAHRVCTSRSQRFLLTIQNCMIALITFKYLLYCLILTRRFGRDLHRQLGQSDLPGFFFCHRNLFLNVLFQYDYPGINGFFPEDNAAVVLCSPPLTTGLTHAA